MWMAGWSFLKGLWSSRRVIGGFFTSVPGIILLVGLAYAAGQWRGTSAERQACEERIAASIAKAREIDKSNAETQAERFRQQAAANKELADVLRERILEQARRVAAGEDARGCVFDDTDLGRLRP